MTGTSLDGLDTALVEIHGRGLDMRASFIRGLSRGLGDIAGTLRRMADQVPLTSTEIASAMLAFTNLHTQTITELLAGDHADLVCVHGQTVCHAPPVSWQMFNPTPLAQRLNAPVVCDLRASDLSVGGQGAPITPLADLMIFADASPRCVVNLGGFCNMTLLPGVVPGASRADTRDRVRGFDLCACNHVLDRVARVALRKPFDDGGASAMAGRVDADSLHELIAVLRTQAGQRRSLGTGDEAAAWVDRHAGRVTAPDLGATACEAIARCIADRVGDAESIVLAGGGAKNLALRSAIGRATGRRTIDTAALGVPIDMREAACMAVLGALCEDRVPITLRQISGAEAETVAGVWAFPSRLSDRGGT
jgi:anhydro-N-acetylmuramic acid kinase